MGKIITLPQVGIIVDTIYRNSIKPKYEQKSIRDLASHTEVSYNVLGKIRDILRSMRLLIVEGEKAGQKSYWNPSKSIPNPAMVIEVYRIYTKDIKSKIKVVSNKQPRVPSFELAIQTLVKLGWCGVIQKVTVNGIVRTIQEIDLSAINHTNQN